jgi:hypothetical protein
MKKYLLVMASALAVQSAQSQEIQDALRYSMENINGTARFRAMSGAFGALGGDFSAINVNPAGSAIFLNNQVGLTLSSYNTSNKSSYFGTDTSEEDNSFDLNQAGGVLVFDNDEENSDWKKFTLALNYENTNNYDNTYFSAGTNPTNSIDNYFLSFAQGAPLNLLQDALYEDLNFADQQAFLGYQGFVVNPAAEDPANTAYVSNVPAGSFYQENSFASTGYNGKVTINFASQYQDWLYIGFNTNFYTTDYRQSTSFYEENTNDPDAGVQRLRFNNRLYTYGTGFSFNLGAIGKFRDFRVGLAYESPTWYRLNDEFSQDLSVVHILDGVPTTTIVDPNIIMVYDTHKLTTPGKWTASAAYVFGKSGLISVDYSLKDYSNLKFRPESDFMEVNDVMADALDQASELRIGGEYRIKQWSLRGGYRMEQSPYKDDNIVGDLNGFSAGIGYNFGETKLDLSYSYSKRDSQQGFFSTGLTDGAAIQSVNNNVSVSLLFEL